MPTAWTAFQPHSQLTHILLIFEAVFLMGCQGESLREQSHAASWVDSNTKYVKCVVDDARSRIAMMTESGKIQVGHLSSNSNIHVQYLFLDCLH